MNLANDKDNGDYIILLLVFLLLMKRCCFFFEDVINLCRGINRFYQFYAAICYHYENKTFIKG